jgi:hypothetical protein
LQKNKKGEKLNRKEVIKMAEEKMNGKCNCGHGNKYMLFGILAIVYGIITYFINVMNWQSYMAWIVGGVILVLIAWIRGSMRG